MAAAAAWPAIEAIAVRIGALILGGVIGKAATDTAKDAQKKRQEEEEEKKGKIPPPPPLPAPQGKSGSGTQSDSGTKSSADRQKCKKCPPDEGHTVIRNHGWSPEVVAYQFRICGLPHGPGWITEWHFGGRDFDGFDSNQCLLKEAKATYDQFFDKSGKFTYPFQRRIFTDMVNTAIQQNSVAVPKPPIQLHWYFMEPISHQYMKKQLRSATPQIKVIFQP